MHLMTLSPSCLHRRRKIARDTCHAAALLAFDADILARLIVLVGAFGVHRHAATPAHVRAKSRRLARPTSGRETSLRALLQKGDRSVDATDTTRSAHDNPLPIRKAEQNYCLSYFNCNKELIGIFHTWTINRNLEVFVRRMRIEQVEFQPIVSDLIERHPAREQLERDEADRPDIAGRGELMPLQYLRSRPATSAQEYLMRKRKSL
jgi:hypothetical protein